MKFRKALIIAIVFIFASLLTSPSFATHISGGYITYECLGEANGRYNYDITLHFFRDCNGTPQFPVGNTPFDATIRIRIFDGKYNGFISEAIMQLGDSTETRFEVLDSCSQTLQPICYAKTEYTTRVSLSENESGYHISWIRCCRGGEINNIENPDNTGMILNAFIPATSLCNNSPQFISEFPVIFFKDVRDSLDFSAIDLDGDSLSYEMIEVTRGGYRLDPIPTPLPPPYGTANYLPDFSVENPLGESSLFELDPVTGQLTVLPNIVGTYVFAIKVKEYRNGQLLSETPREVLVNVFQKFKEPCLVPEPVSYLYNFPNPFTHSTNFSFFFQTEAKVTLEVFDIKGRKVAVLINRDVEEGFLELEWTPQGLASGLYYYRLLQGDELITAGKMIYNHP